MTALNWEYLIFGIIVVLALVVDLGVLSKKNEVISMKTALKQTAFWVSLGLAYFLFLLIFDEKSQTSLDYLSAYLMEWSLSIDNIFVFILIFSAFSVSELNYGRILLIGILLAIVLRVVFIFLGVELVERFEQVLYLFGAFLLYTGIKMFTTNHEDDSDPKDNKVYKLLKRFMPLTEKYDGSKFSTLINGKKFYTPLFVVVVMVATTDIVFALDSIPAVMGISKDLKVIITSNIFAVLGLRSLFFLLRGAINQFEYLPKGIAIVLVFIGVKMILPLLYEFKLTTNPMHFPAWISLVVILVCLLGSIVFSILHKEKGEK